MIAATPPVHNLVLNVRSFNSLARNIWGGDAAVITLQLDETLIRIDRSRRNPAKLAKEIRTLEQQGARALQTLDPTGSPIAVDAIHALRTNLTQFRAVLKSLKR